MQAISFCLNGKMAHFRKYYSNSTALSHLVPPVATIKGIIAGLLGYERDSYYEEFSDKRCKVALCVKSPLKKITQTMNLLKVESLNHLNGAGLNRTQNHTEFVVPKNLQSENICYEVIFYHEDRSVMEKLTAMLCLPSQAYLSQGISIALGSAQCLGWISQGKIVELEKRFSDDAVIAIRSAVALARIEKICLEKENCSNFFKEETIMEFDEHRLITEGSRKEILFNLEDTALSLILKQAAPYYVMDAKENIVFLE
ncbi:CRISPR-associated protein Cas5 [Anaerosinus sp.]|uniref:CRISPR-associated protein Cas5 n=1 Tax=Selenobaculum sp. TaxID=3074374 RepID=UPI003AB86983